MTVPAEIHIVQEQVNQISNAIWGLFSAIIVSAIMRAIFNK